jgi:hypothetical protein
VVPVLAFQQQVLLFPEDFQVVGIVAHFVDQIAHIGTVIHGKALGRVQLAQIAKFTTIEAPAQISRENGMRRVVAEVNIRGRDLGGFVSEVQGKLAPLVKGLPSGYYVEYGGQFENQQRAMRQLAIVVPVALLGSSGILPAGFGILPNPRDPTRSKVLTKSQSLATRHHPDRHLSLKAPPHHQTEFRNIQSHRIDARLEDTRPKIRTRYAMDGLWQRWERDGL